MGGRDSVVGMGDPHDAGPGAPVAAWAVDWARAPREGARGASLPRECRGGVAREGTPQFRELVGSEAVVVPGGAIVGESAEGSSCQGSHTSQP